MPVNFAITGLGWFIAFNVLYNHFMCATTNAGKPPSHREYAEMRRKETEQFCTDVDVWKRKLQANKFKTKNKEQELVDVVGEDYR